MIMKYIIWIWGDEKNRPDQNRIIDNDDDVDDAYLIRELNSRLK